MAIVIKGTTVTGLQVQTTETTTIPSLLATAAVQITAATTISLLGTMVEAEALTKATNHQATTATVVPQVKLKVFMAAGAQVRTVATITTITSVGPRALTKETITTPSLLPTQAPLEVQITVVLLAIMEVEVGVQVRIMGTTTITPNLLAMVDGAVVRTKATTTTVVGVPVQIKETTTTTIPSLLPTQALPEVQIMVVLLATTEAGAVV